MTDECCPDTDRRRSPARQDPFADGVIGVDPDNKTYGNVAESTANSTGDAFNLFGTSVLVIPAAAVLAVLIGGLVGAISMGGSLPGMGGGGGGQRRRRRR